MSQKPGHRRHTCDYVTCDEAGRFRVRVVSALGQEVIPGTGLLAADPAAAKPHFGKEGWCDMDAVPFPDTEPDYTNPRIELDDGSVIWGYQCWWQQLLTPAGVVYMARIRAEMDEARAASDDPPKMDV